VVLFSDRFYKLLVLDLGKFCHEQIFYCNILPFNLQSCFLALDGLHQEDIALALIHPMILSLGKSTQKLCHKKAIAVLSFTVVSERVLLP